MLGSSFIYRLLVTCLGAFALAGCSPDALFGGRDQEVAQGPTYRTIFPGCNAIKLSGNKLDAAQYRAVLRCLNSEGQLAPLEALANRMSDAEMDPIVSALNRYLVDPRKRLYEIDQVVRRLDESGGLDPLLSSLGDLLKDDQDFVLGALLSFRDAYQTHDARVAFDRGSLLGIMERVSSRLTPSRVSVGLEGALDFMESKAAGEFRRKAQGLVETPRGIGAISLGALDFLRGLRQGPDVLQNILIAARDGRFFTTIDAIYGQTPEELRSGIPSVALGFELLTKDGQRNARELMDFFSKVKAPIECLNGSMRVENPPEYAIEELVLRGGGSFADFVLRETPLRKSIEASFCELPAIISQRYDVIRRLARSNASESYDLIAKSFFNAKMTSEFTQMLSADAMPHLMPLLGEIQERDLWKTVFLLLTMGKSNERETLQESLAYVLEPVESLGGRSIYAVVVDALSRARPENFERLARGVAAWADGYLTLPSAPTRALTQMRAAFYSTEVHPFLDAGREFLSEARSQQALFDTVFKIADYPEFRGFVRFMGEMARDGRLKDLMRSMLNLFSGMVQEGRYREIGLTPIPPRSPDRLHDMDSSDLDSLKLVEFPEDIAEPCSQINFSIRLESYLAPQYSRQLDAYLACLKTTERDEDLSGALEVLWTSTSSKERPILFALMDSIKTVFDYSALQAKDMTTRQFGMLRDGRFDRTAGLIRLVMPVAYPLIDAMPVVYSAIRTHLETMMAWASEEITSPDLPDALEYLDWISDQEPKGDSLVPDLRENRELFNKVRDAVRAHECIQNPRALDARVRQIFDDYTQGATGWEVDASGRARTDWNLKEFRERLGPLLSKLKDPVEQGPAIVGLLDVMRYFTLPTREGKSWGPDPGYQERDKHYTREYLAQWLSERSHDPMPILYFYPEAERPVVRLVNSLDRLELVLINADFKYPGKTNMGIKVLMDIAGSWGDDRKEVWPVGMKDPPTLRQTYESIVTMLEASGKASGYPLYSKCEGVRPVLPTPTSPVDRLPPLLRPPVPEFVRRNLFNIWQVVGVIEEDLPGKRGGMRVLRDLFWQLYSSTPEKFRNPESDNRNNLWVVTQLVRAGIMRQISKRLMREPPITGPLSHGGTWAVGVSPERLARNQGLLDFFRGFVDAAAAPEVQPMLDVLLVEDRDQSLVWKGIEAAFAVIDRSPEDAASMRGLLMYLIGAGGQLKAYPPALKALEGIFREHGTYLEANSRRIGDLLTDSDLAKWSRAFQESDSSGGKDAVGRVVRDALAHPGLAQSAVGVLRIFDESPQARAHWDEFKKLASRLGEDPEYLGHKPRELAREIIKFLRETSPPGSALKTRQNIAALMKSGDLLELMELASQKPEAFKELLRTVDRHIQNGDLKDFITRAEHALGE